MTEPERRMVESDEGARIDTPNELDGAAVDEDEDGEDVGHAQQEEGSGGE